jgi:hypothetical protein
MAPGSSFASGPASFACALVLVAQQPPDYPSLLAMTKVMHDIEPAFHVTPTLYIPTHTDPV